MQIQTYGLLLALSLLCSIVITHFLSKEKMEAQRSFWAIALPLSFLGSRLLYILPNLRYYLEEISYPLAMLFFWDGGLSLFGALLGFLLAMSIAKKRGIFADFHRFANAAFTTLWLFVCGMRFAEGFAGMGLGKPFDAENGGLFIVNIYDYSHLAVYRLEAVFAAIMLVASLILFSKMYRKDDKVMDSYLGMLSLLMLSVSQVVFESMRNDGHLLIGFIHVQQVLFAVLIVSLLYYIRSRLPIQSRINSWLLLALVIVLVGIDFAMEFVVDGRLNLPLSLFGMSSFARNYLIISLVSACFAAIGIHFLCQLYCCRTALHQSKASEG